MGIREHEINQNRAGARLVKIAKAGWEDSCRSRDEPCVQRGQNFENMNETNEIINKVRKIIQAGRSGTHL